MVKKLRPYIWEICLVLWAIWVPFHYGWSWLAISAQALVLCLVVGAFTKSSYEELVQIQRNTIDIQEDTIETQRNLINALVASAREGWRD